MSIGAGLTRKALEFSELIRKETSLETLEARRTGFNKLGRWFTAEKGTVVTRTTIGGVAVDSFVNCVEPGRTIVYAHGGGFVYGGNSGHMSMLSMLSRLAEARILAVDYRIAPEDGFPAALDDIEAVLDTLDCVYSLAGDSAGGNLVLSTAVHRRDQSLSVPKCIVAISPCLDATFSGESITKNARTDPMLTIEKLRFFLKAYAGTSDVNNPRISPLFSDLSDLPPTLFHVSSNEILYSDSQRAHDKIKSSGGTSAIYTPADMWHAWHLFSRFVPESRVAIRGVAQFISDNS